MPRTPEQNQQIKDKRRGKLLLISLKVFASKGYDQVTIDNITAAAKCSHGLFYHYFDSKDRVFVAVMKEIIEPSGIVPPLEQAKQAGGVAGLRLLCDYAESMAKGTSKELFGCQIILSSTNQKTIDRAIPDFLDRYYPFNTLRKLIAEGQKEGKVIAGNPAEIATAMIDLLSASLERILKGSSAQIISSDVLLGMLLKGPIEG